MPQTTSVPDIDILKPIQNSIELKIEPELYTSKVYHIFFHSLVIYPELAFKNDQKGKLYSDYMITKDQFVSILDTLYAQNFVLVDITSLYAVDEKGTVSSRPIYIPKGKKPLVISLDDLSYYTFMKGRGFANKLVLDAAGKVATEVITPTGETVVTRDGDVIPLLDDFIEAHPDFSVDGARGVIALTGFEGILGYRTQYGSPTRSTEIETVRGVVGQLQKTGWKFASHSYEHDHPFWEGSKPLEDLKIDTREWKEEVEPLVGKTDIFIGPFGEIFKERDPRRNFLISQGFKMFCGVGLDMYLGYYTDHVVMNRVDIDGYQLRHNPLRLHSYFGI